jgi:hypothetical protein
MSLLSEVRRAQDAIIANMPRGANNQLERSDYADFLVQNLEQCHIQDRVKQSLIQEIKRIDLSKPSPSLYRRLSWKTLLALDEQMMHENRKASASSHPTDDHISKNDSESIEYKPNYVVNCLCAEKKQQKLFNPIECFVRAAQEQFGTDNVAVLIRGDIFALSFQKRTQFPWDMVISLEASFLVDSSLLSSHALHEMDLNIDYDKSGTKLVDDVMKRFREHAKNWGSFWFMPMPIWRYELHLPSHGKIVKIPCDIGPSDIICFDELYGNLVTTTGHLYGSEEALARLAASMARRGMGRDYHVARTVNLYKHTVALAKAWSETRKPHPDILTAWEKPTSPAYSYLLLMLANGLKGG